MNNLKEINGQYYKECNVVMLPTKDKSYIWWNGFKLKDTMPPEIMINGNEFQHLYIISNEEIKEGDWVINYYNVIAKWGGHGDLNGCKKIIASTDKSLGLSEPSQDFLKLYIEEYNKSNQIKKVLVEYIKLDNIYITQNDLDSLNCTDFSKVSSKYGFKYVDNFFKAMNKTLFLIEGYKVYKIRTVQFHDIYLDYFKGDFLFEITEFEGNAQLKIKPDNTISIKQQKDSWNREEHLLEIQRICKLLYFSPNYKVDFINEEDLNKWIEENLI